MKICFVTPELSISGSATGGLGQYLRRLTTGLAAAGHEVHILLRSQTPGTLQVDGVTIHQVVPWWGTRFRLDRIDMLVPKSIAAPYQDIKAAWCLWRAWKSLKKVHHFDLVQIANVLAVGLFFRREKRVPIVIRMSSYRPVWDTAALSRITLATRIRWFLERRSVVPFRHIYAPSRYVAELVEKNYRTPRVAVLESPFIPNTRPSDLAIWHRYPQLAASPYVLFFGRLTMMKGVDVLAEALAPLLTNRPKLHAVFIGPDGPGPSPGGCDMREHVRTKLGAHADRVLILDALPHDQLKPFIEHAPAVALPSRMDNLPNTCLEAMAAGRVVVATTGSCFEQLIVDGQTGLLCPPGNPAALHDQITTALDLTATAREAMGGLARTDLQRLRPEQSLPRLLEYYGKLIGDTGASPPKPTAK